MENHGGMQAQVAENVEFLMECAYQWARFSRMDATLERRMDRDRGLSEAFWSCVNTHKAKGVTPVR